MPVHPDGGAVAGVLAYPDVASLPTSPDLAVICTPPETVPGLVNELGRLGTRAAAVLTGLGRDTKRREEILAAAGRHGLRVLGPNCLGLLVPGIGLNASFAHVGAATGELAFVSQSGAVCTAALDWARGSNVGFSCVVSLGDSVDVDAGDLLDHLGADPHTRAILLYLESVGSARKFLSAARAAARNKPVLVIKSGRAPEGARAAASHTGALAGSDEVYEAAIRRAGMLRVTRIDELFAAAETLARARRISGDRLAILTNGGGLAVLATDTLIARGGRLADLGEATLHELDEVLPPTWSHSNPVDIIGDAPGERFADSLRILAGDPGTDAVLVIHAPTAIASGADAARAVAGEAGHDRAILASWVGREERKAADRILHEAGIPTYDTPDDAIAAFLHLAEFRRNQELLTETPPSLSDDFEPDVATARGVVDRALAEGREWLSEPEAKSVLAAFRIPCVETRTARTGKAAARAAEAIGFPVALKILSPEVTHKSDVGGVELDLETSEAVAEAATAMAQRLRQQVPGARLDGYAIQPMARRPGSLELIAGAACDPVFGPVILFGQGGTGVEVIGDRAIALPPLNLHLARELVGRTRVARLLAGYRDRAPADLDALCLTLVQVSQLMIELPRVVELDINPLLADPGGVLALDARIRVSAEAARDRLAIRPYPRELEETVRLSDGRALQLRPIRPEDEPAHDAFFRRLQPDDVRFRFFNMVREMPHSQLARYTQIDYDREMAFIATDPSADPPETLGVVRAVFHPDGTEAEFAIIVQSDLKGLGLGHLLLDKLVRYCRARGARELVGQVLPDNRPMLSLARHLGFESRMLPDDGVVEVRLRLQRGRARSRRQEREA
jgi:acetyltransferase